MCPPDKFRCNYGACVDDNLECDGIEDCADGSDEKQCGQHLGSCSSTEYKCSSGKCIPIRKLCDGNFDCEDGSDEGNICKKTTACPPFTHRCKAGSCIYLNKRCDGHRDCIDGSDEGQFCSKLKCTGSKCHNDVFCPPIIYDRINAICEVPRGTHKGIVDCSKPLPTETVVSYDCKPYYIPATHKHINNKEMICQADGTWNREPLRCIPDCGTTELDVAPLIVNGWISAKGKFPWHAVLFLLEEGQWIFICGGTLITERIVITAAHCAWNIHKELLQVGLGKYYSDYYKDEDNAQFHNISKIFIQPSYQDLAANYGSDIAILVLKSIVEFSDVIKPACIDWRLKDITENLGREKLGLVVGMGVTENNTFSAELRAVYLPVVNNSYCIQNQKKEFQKYITFTSFCAGWRNGTGVCNGDSGGGLVFPSMQDPNKYTLQGIVSVSPRRPGTSFCNSNFFTVFTKVGIFTQWIYDTIKNIHDDVKYQSNVIF